ncbi:uncharacterized protein LOC115959959 [Quercus lobata]|uniref:uncharacterized protein LOC115959959 n=1 Tax=Quercus lobata TaxID=97700 RepID=UPI001248CF0E|nr:uncharacterized protein LOC115959959 [Quercus lobata]
MGLENFKNIKSPKHKSHMVQDDYQKEVFSISAWLLWNRRNASHFGRPVHPIANIVSMAGNMLQEFLIAEDKEPVKPLPPISHQWRPPELNQYKVNFDAAVFRTTNSAGIGVIVRDWRGELVGALWLTPSLIWRLWQAEFGLQTVVFEGDSTMVINAINQGNAGFSTYRNSLKTYAVKPCFFSPLCSTMLIVLLTVLLML